MNLIAGWYLMFSTSAFHSLPPGPTRPSPAANPPSPRYPSALHGRDRSVSLSSSTDTAKLVLGND